MLYIFTLLGLSVPHADVPVRPAVHAPKKTMEQTLFSGIPLHSEQPGTLNPITLTEWRGAKGEPSAQPDR